MSVISNANSLACPKYPIDNLSEEMEAMLEQEKADWVVLQEQRDREMEEVMNAPPPSCACKCRKPFTSLHVTNFQRGSSN